MVTNFLSLQFLSFFTALSLSYTCIAHTRTAEMFSNLPFHGNNATVAGALWGYIVPRASNCYHVFSVHNAKSKHMTDCK